jgi:predicted membrane channel-forming protein YqfA (hemolysin III family)
MTQVESIRIMAGMFLALVFLGVLLIPTIFYILTLSKALNKCSPASRTMQPGTLWLLLIPLFNLIWHFLVVSGMAQSLGNEFRARNIIAEPEPGKSLGMAMCICAACGIIPVLGLLTSLASLVLWIMYWSKIAGFSHQLDALPYISAAPGVFPGT